MNYFHHLNYLCFCGKTLEIYSCYFEIYNTIIDYSHLVGQLISQIIPPI
jgi:hypothetical protein